jgi:hypothetical protein
MHSSLTIGDAKSTLNHLGWLIFQHFSTGEQKMALNWKVVD